MLLAMLLAKLGRRKAAMDHRHQGLAVTVVEGELGLVLDDRSFRAALGRVEDKTTRGERVEHHLGARIDYPLASHVVAHRLASLLST
jgi:hypothetical protein